MPERALVGSLAQYPWAFRIIWSWQPVTSVSPGGSGPHRDLCVPGVCGERELE